MMKKLFLILALLALPAVCQYTTVSGTITDSNSLPYAGGLLTVTFAPGSSGGPYTFLGSPGFTKTYQATLNSAGAFSLSLPSNTGTQSISPNDSQWTFTVASALFQGSRYGQYSAAITVTGSTQSVTSNLSNQASILVPASQPISVLGSASGGTAGNAATVTATSTTSNTAMPFGLVATTSSTTSAANYLSTATLNPSTGGSVFPVTGDNGVQVGITAGYNLFLDPNTITANDNGSATTLYLNPTASSGAILAVSPTAYGSCSALNTNGLGSVGCNTNTLPALVGSVQISVTGNTTALGSASNTGTVSGAATTNAVFCSAAGTADADVGVAQAYVSAANTVTLAIRTFVTDSSAPSITYNCRVIQ